MSAIEPISVRILTLSQLFADGSRFGLPHFQRAYAWGVDQVIRLLGDLQEAAGKSGARRWHFLGRILLAKPDGSARAAIVDGHQRLMTLTIIFSVARDLCPDGPRRQQLARLVSTQGADGTGDHLTLLPQQSIVPLMVQFVQDQGATQRPLDDDLANLSEPEANIIANRDQIRDVLATLGEHELDAFTEFLLGGCRIEVLEVEDENEAWSMLQIEEQTGLPFNATDRAKATLLSAMPAADRRICGPVWEAWQGRLGATDMEALLGHIRLLALRTRSAMPVETELIRHFGFAKAGVAFFERELVPRADVLARLREPATGGTPFSEAVAASIARASWVERQLWVPAALLWGQRRGFDNPETGLMFARLERLVWMMRFSGTDPYVQQNRMIAVLAGIDGRASVADIRALDVTAKMRNEALANLRSTTFYSKHYCGATLRRLSVIYGPDPGPVDKVAVTVEHILPRNPGDNSQWLRLFGSRKEVTAYANRLGNLTFLTEQQNQEAAAHDWPVKQGVLAKAAQFSLSVAAAEKPEWSRRVIEQRTEALIAALFGAWDLGAP
jgi:hypothetical protein